MVVSMVPTVFATNTYDQDYTDEIVTNVTYMGTGTEEWTVTVPATLAPGAVGEITASGTWSSIMQLIVSTDDYVCLTNNLSGEDVKELAVTFEDINLVGDNSHAVSETKQISVAAMPSDALFGTWSGVIYYNLYLDWSSDIMNFNIGGTQTVAKKGMTWRELITLWGIGFYADGDNVVFENRGKVLDGETPVTLDEEIKDGYHYDTET